MNKKMMIILCVAAVLFVVLFCSLLIQRNSLPKEPDFSNASTTTNTVDTQSDGTDATNETDQTDQTNQTNQADESQSEVKSEGQGVGNIEDGGFDETNPTVGNTADETDASTEPTAPTAGKGSTKPEVLLTYEEFLAISSAEQEKYFHAFSDPADYIQWLTQAREAYEETQTTIIATGDVDLGEIP